MREENVKKEKSRNVLAFIFRHAKGYLHWIVFSLVLSAFGIVANYLVQQMLRIAVDGVLADAADTLPGPALLLLNMLKTLDSQMGQLIALAVVAFVVFVLGEGFNFAARMFSATGTERFSRRLRGKLFSHVQSLPFKWHVDNQTGEIIQRCTSDLEVVRNFLADQLIEVIRTLILMVVALWLMFSMNVALSLVSLAFIPVVFLYSGIFYRLIGKHFLVADEAEGALTAKVQENLTGVRVVRAFGRERFELERFDEQNNFFANLWMKLGKTLSVYWGTGDIVTGLQILAVILVGGIMAAQGEITAGEYLVFVAYNQSLTWPIRALGRILSEMSKTGVSANRLQEILDAGPEPEEPEAKKPPLNADIHFENVTFGYEQQPVLKDLSFIIPAGKTFGILGATGSGKSTITYLLNRLYDLPEGFGSIRFGDVEIRDIDRQYLRRNVGVVLQEPFLFSKTIEENIAITEQETPDRPRIHRAARVAAVHDAISEFSHGYETVVGERGVTLSGGQKQRVAIARTLMLDAPVMVFDDSLSAVDLETDAQIRAALKSETGDATVILISHRINTLMAADTIMVLDEGCVEAIGTHAELIRKAGTYKRIYDMQSEAAADAGERLEDLALGGAGAAAPLGGEA